MNKYQLISIKISSGNYCNFLKEIASLITDEKKYSDYICVANAHMLVEAHQNKDFANLVNNAIITTPDGTPLTWGLRLLYGIKQDRVAGMDLLPDLLNLASEQKKSVFFYGSTELVLEQTKIYIKKNYPGITKTETFSPPFGRQLTTEENSNVIDIINNSGAKLVFVILGCPKQERWMHSMKGKINALMIGVGGALPVLIGEQKRAPHWMQKSGLEWLYRFFQEPTRLWKRYLFTNSMFIYLLLKEKIRMTFVK